MVDTNGLKKGLLILLGLLGVAIGLYALMMIGGLVVGTVAETATGSWNGTAYTDVNNKGIVDSTAMLNAIQGYETDYISFADTSSSATPVIAGLVLIVVIMVVFGIKFNWGKGRSME